jgi:hypothetical protein
VHFDLTDLCLFAAVVEEGSISAGASRAGISLPSASARMKGMEEMLGTALLERHHRDVRPTRRSCAVSPLSTRFGTNRDPRGEAHSSGPCPCVWTTASAMSRNP